jgi:hypothetical protein
MGCSLCGSISTTQSFNSGEEINTLREGDKGLVVLKMKWKAGSELRCCRVGVRIAKVAALIVWYVVRMSVTLRSSSPPSSLLWALLGAKAHLSRYEGVQVTTHRRVLDSSAEAFRETV